MHLPKYCLGTNDCFIACNYSQICIKEVYTRIDATCSIRNILMYDRVTIACSFIIQSDLYYLRYLGILNFGLKTADNRGPRIIEVLQLL